MYEIDRSWDTLLDNEESTSAPVMTLPRPAAAQWTAGEYCKVVRDL